jgi:hypothetical protein
VTSKVVIARTADDTITVAPSAHERAPVPALSPLVRSQPQTGSKAKARSAPRNSPTPTGSARYTSAANATSARKPKAPLLGARGGDDLDRLGLGWRCRCVGRQRRGHHTPISHHSIPVGAWLLAPNCPEA